MVDVVEAYKEKKSSKINRAIWQVERLIDAIGIDEAFKVLAATLLYSGPRESIRVKYEACANNHERTYDAFENKKHSLLDETYIGQTISNFRGIGFSIYDYFVFDALRSSNTPLGRNQKFALKEEGNSIADAVMEHVSKRFIDHAHGDVETCVCGADLSRVFYQIEMEALLSNDKVTTINGLPRQKFEAILKSGEPDAKYKTFTAICEAELEMIYTRATDPSNKHQKFWKDEYKGRKAFFEMEQEETALARAKNTAAVIAPSRPANGVNPPASKKVAGLH